MAPRLQVHAVLGKQNGGDAHRQANLLRTILNDIFNQFVDASEEITLDAMRPTFEKSQEYTPYLTGKLRESGYLEIVGFRGNPRVEIGYGKGGIPPYTAEVHEMTDVPHALPTRSKFLQAAVMEDLDDIYTRIGKGYFSFMNGGGGFGQ